MKIFPIYYNKSPLPVGVEIRYEEQDAEYLVHMLYFLEAYAERNKDASLLIPAISLNGSKSSVRKLKKEFEKYLEGERSINGYISLYFLDGTRATFEEYQKVVHAIKNDAEKTFEWGVPYEFFALHAILLEAERLFFPKKSDMH